MSSRRHAIPLAIVLACAWTSPARCGWQAFSISEGLASHVVTAAATDSAGNDWFGTAFGGVSRYDGVHWTTFSRAAGLPDSNVSCVYTDHRGRVWVGTGGFRSIVSPSGYGVSCYDGRQWRTYTTADGLADNTVNAILEDHLGNMWFATSAGASRFDGTQWSTFSPSTTAGQLPGNAVWAMLEDANGSMWFATGDSASYNAGRGLQNSGRGVTRWDGAAWRTFTTADGLGEDQVASLLQARDGSIWIAGASFQPGYPVLALDRFDGSSWRPVPLPPGSQGVDIAFTPTALLRDGRGDIWVAGRDAYRFDGREWRTFDTSIGLADDYVNALMEDRVGNVWFGTTFAGVCRWDREQWSSLAKPDGTPLLNVNLLLRDRTSDALWIGTDSGLSVDKLDGSPLRSFSTADGLPDPFVESILQDHLGRIWVGTYGGLARFNGVGFDSFRDSVPFAGPQNMPCVVEDHLGNLWIAYDGVGVERYDGASWRLFTTADGLANNHVTSIAEDHAGNLWFGCRADFDSLFHGTGGGATRFDGTNWRTFTAADGLGGTGPQSDNTVWATFVDHAGNVWCATNGGGVGRYDGTNWRTFTSADGLAIETQFGFAEDPAFRLWLSSQMSGVSRFDGQRWRIFRSTDGLLSNNVHTLLADGDRMLFATDAGISVYEPDRVPPISVLLQKPAALASQRQLDFTYAAAFGETQGIEFSTSFDDEPWSPWTTIGNVRRDGVMDGAHIFRVRTRDLDLNVEPWPARWSFEVDATPPSASISSPLFDQAIQGTFDIEGRAADARFARYDVAYRPVGAASWTPLLGSTAPVNDGSLARWDTSRLADGDYDLRVVVTDTLGLEGTASLRVVVDNQLPRASDTTPARVTAARGGDVYTTTGQVHLYFPPHAFREDAIVHVETASDSALPLAGATQGRRVGAGFAVSWGNARMDKAATIDLACADSTGQAIASPAIYVSTDSAEGWHRLGGTVDPGSRRIALSITTAGAYAVFMGGDLVPGPATLTALTLTPRVFSPRGNFAAEQAAIGFFLGQGGPVTVRVYNRAGRVVRELVAGQPMNAGSNLVRWDGKDSSGATVTDGLYLISVKATGQELTKPLAVVR